jgi:DNA-binding transcriptional LysR family regulator
MNRVDALTLFVKVVDAGSLSGAARTLGLSLASVSRHVTEIEENAGTRLVVRTTRSLVLTDAGRLYYERAKRILVDIEELETALLADSTVPTGRLHVSGPTLFGRVFMLPLLARFLAANRKVTMDVTLVDRHVNVVEEGIDLAVRIGQLDDSSLIVRKLRSLLWVVAGAPDYLKQRGQPKTPDDLAQHDCLVFTQRLSGAEWQFFKDGQVLEQRVPVKMRSNTLDGVVAAAVNGVGLVRAPAWQVREYVAAGQLKVVLRDYEAPPFPIQAVLTHNKLLSSKVRALLDFLIEQWASKNFDEVPEFGSAKRSTRR